MRQTWATLFAGKRKTRLYDGATAVKLRKRPFLIPTVCRLIHLALVLNSR